MADTAEPADTERAAARHYLLSFEADTIRSRPHHNAAIAVGSTVALLGLFASPISGASMNPARSLGPDIVSTDFTGWWVYVLGPAIGACIAVLIIGLVRGLPGRSEQAAAEGADLPMQNETD